MVNATTEGFERAAAANRGFQVRSFAAPVGKSFFDGRKPEVELFEIVAEACQISGRVGDVEFFVRLFAFLKGNFG